MSCTVVGKMADVNAATLEDAETCALSDPADDEALGKRLFARAMARALASARVTGVTAMVEALASGIHPLRQQKSTLDGMTGAELAATLAAELAKTLSPDEAEEELAAREALLPATKTVAESKPRSWEGRAIDTVLAITNEKVAARTMSRGQAAMLNMLNLQAVSESKSPEEAARRFALKLEAIGQKAEADRAFDAMQEQKRRDHTVASLAHNRGEVEQVRLNPATMAIVNEPDTAADREREQMARDRAERERERAVAEQIHKRWRREAQHPNVLGHPQRP